MKPITLEDEEEEEEEAERKVSLFRLVKDRNCNSFLNVDTKFHDESMFSCWEMSEMDRVVDWRRSPSLRPVLKPKKVMESPKKNFFDRTETSLKESNNEFLVSK